MSAPKSVDLALLERVRAAIAVFPPRTSQREMIEKLTASGRFANISSRNLRDLIAATSVSDYAFELFKTKKLSFSMLRELGRGQVDDATRDFLARAAVERRMSAEQMMDTKNYLKKRCSVAEALGKACGQIPKVATPASERPASVEAIHDEIMRMGTQWRMKVSMAMDLLPATTLEGKSTRMLIFKKAYELRHLVKEQLSFIEQKVEQFLKEVEGHATAEAVVASRRGVVPVNGETHEHDPGDGGHEDEAGASSVGQVEPAVQDPAQDA